MSLAKTPKPSMIQSTDLNPDDGVWMDVIHKMDETYAELVHY